VLLVIYIFIVSAMCVAVMHELRLIHTDLKPENILLVSAEYTKVPDYKVSSRSPKEGSYYKRLPKSSEIKVIDFGSTTYDQQDQTYVVSTRHYRAPEVILGTSLSSAKPMPSAEICGTCSNI
jgi:dual-specificity kinase